MVKVQKRMNTQDSKEAATGSLRRTGNLTMSQKKNISVHKVLVILNKKLDQNKINYNDKTGKPPQVPSYITFSFPAN